MSFGRDEQSQVTGHGLGPKAETEIIREFALSLRSGADSGLLTQRYIVKFPAYAEALRRIARDLAGDLDVTRVAGVSDDRTLPASNARLAPLRQAAQAAAHTGGFALSRSVVMPPVDLAEGSPERLGRFQLIRELGRGGMGVVFLALDEDLGRLVAVKTLRAESLDRGDAQTRFKREQAALISLDHPGIVPVYESGEAEGLLYLAMRYVEGASLDAWAKELRLNAQENTASTAQSSDVSPILAAVGTVARALQHAHSLGLLHRDVKPANIMVDHEGNPLLLDFGLARNVLDETITRSGSLPGTLPYMSPEALKSREIDHRADLYSLGVTIFEALTGSRPFDGPRPEVIMYGILKQEAPRPRSLRSGLSRDVETVILKCLEKEPQRRYANCGELADELERLLAHQRIQAEPVGRLGRAWRYVDRNRAISIGLFLTTITLIVALALFLQATNQHERQRQQDAELARQSASELVAQTLEQTERISAIALARRQIAEDSQTAADRAQLVALATEERQLRDLRREAWQSALQDSQRAFALDPRPEDQTLSQELQLRLAGQNAGTGTLTVTTKPPGVRLRAQRYEPGPDGRLVLAAPMDLGPSPVVAQELAVGSYVLELSHPGYLPLSYPVLIEADQHWGDPSFADGKFARADWTIPLYPEGHHDPELWATVPAGPFLATQPERWLGTKPELAWRWAEAYLIAKQELAFSALFGLLREPSLQEILANDLNAVGDSAFLPIASHAGGQQKHRLLYDPISGDLSPGPAQPELSLMQELPACGLSFLAADNLAGFLSVAWGMELTLPTANQWEKAARGVDGRVYPWGDRLDWSFLAARRGLPQALEAGAITLPSASRSADLSPYGCWDMAGNAKEWSLTEVAETGVQNFYILGGSLAELDPLDFCCWPKRAAPANARGDFYGLRLVRQLP